MAKSKSKKRKTTHTSNLPYTKPTQPNNNDTLTHEEIWDDSALQRSWNDAVAEYEFYHSIDARGEDVDEVIARHLAATTDTGTAIGTAGTGTGIDGVNDDPESDEEGELIEDGELDEGEIDEDPSDAVLRATTTENIAGGDTVNPISVPDPKPDAAVPLSNHPSVTASQDQALENIKMAYYWAGYYSGLYDGQKQATAGAAEGAESHIINPASSLNGGIDTEMPTGS